LQYIAGCALGTVSIRFSIVSYRNFLCK
jgi:hypothetical protein